VFAAKIGAMLEKEVYILMCVEREREIEGE